MLRHIVLWELFFAAPLVLAIGYEEYSEGTLTVNWAIYMVSVGALLGLIAGVLFWWCVVLPIKGGKR